LRRLQKMDFSLSEEQRMLQATARDFLGKECPPALVRDMERDPAGHPLELWRKMTELGWQGLAIPESYGGQGFSFLELMLLLEEMGRVCLPGPFFATVVLGAITVAGGGTEEQKRRLLPLLAGGEATMTLALTEAGGRWDAGGVCCTARPHGDSYLISGTKLFVPYAHVADWLIVAARTIGDGETSEPGITLFLVEGNAQGVDISILDTMGGDRQCEVRMQDVDVGASSILGDVGEGWPIIQRTLEHAVVAKCAEMVGGSQWVLEMTVQYARDRVQFDRPIGSFQAVQHHCANMAADVDGSRFITYLAAWKLSQGLRCSKEVSTAKAWVSEAYRRVTKTAHQVHGGIGFTLDHDLQLYYRQAKAGASAFGNTDYHLERVAAAGL
jgi:alkylation response protein AidB-like acyl-CoA dehydrogenase